MPDTPKTFTVFACPKCGRVVTTALPTLEVSHPCPKASGKVVYLKGTSA